MTVHAVVSAGAAHCAIDAKTLNELQWEQFEHDEQYHREIARLTVHERWKHMALHFAKYAGNLIRAIDDEAQLQQAVVDTFIISLSTTNTLNVCASELLKPGEPAVGTASEFLESLVVSAGRMAAACEKLDHVEAYPFREEVCQAISDLLGATVTLAATRHWHLEQLARCRLRMVKQKWIHHHRMSR